MLTVGWDAPLFDGGDAITGYTVEWDVTPNIGSGANAAQRGSISLPPSQRAYTISRLTANVQYYVRVSASNLESLVAGVGAAALSSPASAAPSLQRPGKPHTILAISGDASGQIKVSWQYPRVPWHNIPCFGTASNPSDCLTDISGGLPMSTGGSTVSEYLVSYNELPDFSGLDGGEVRTTDVQYTLQGLTPSRTYYIRILARNAQGSGPYCAFTEANCLVATTPAKAVAAA
jgi:hypothetical protein